MRQVISYRKAVLEFVEELPGLRLRLRAAQVPDKRVTDKISGSRNPPVPLRVDVTMLINDLDMVINYWGRVVRHHWRLSEGTVSVKLVQRFAVRLLDDPCRGEPFAADLWELRRRVRAVLDPGEKATCVGACPVEVEREGEDGSVVACGGPLLVDPVRLMGSRVVRCALCRTEWDEAGWLHLGSVLRAEAGAGALELA
jgi:hypothetical protein